jgi:hypothetical protein
MHVTQLLDVLAFAKDIEIIVTLVSEGARCFRLPKRHEIAVRALMAGMRDALFENLHDSRDAFLVGLADQHMEVLGHYHVTPNNELVLLPELFNDVKKQMAAGRSEDGLAMVAAAGNEVLLAAGMIAAQSGWHGGLL